jgi:hypothetical protein
MLGTIPAGWSLGNSVTSYDLGYIAQQMLIAANSVGYTGIDNGSTSASTNGSAGVYWFKDVLSAIGDASTGLNSFDFEVAPTEPTNVAQAWPRIGIFNAANLIGAARPEAIFEYGTTKGNLTAYTRQIDRSNLCTKGYIQQPAVSDHTGVLTAEDTAAEAIRGKFEALVDDGGTSWDVLRQDLVNANVQVRKQARQVVTVTPQPNVSPTAFTDFIVGDQIRARIYNDGYSILDAMMRIWGITFNEDQQGNEQMSLELIEP